MRVWSEIRYMSVDLDLEQPEKTEEAGSGASTIVTRLLAGPGVSLLLMAIVSLATWTGIQANNADPFILQSPLTEDWWQLPLSVFAHSGMPHLSANATMIAIFGSVAAISASVLRYHIFFIVSGMLAGAAHVLATAALGTPSGGLGASGTAMALMAYVLVSNDVSSFVFDRVSRTVTIGLVLALAVGLSLTSAGVQVGNVAHLSGALIGGFAGYFHILRPR
ncbi:hypothetical protein DJ78_01985 [Halorubrum ezzemoulense]|uniref:Peptidase S54 rhomboid domain-containing protein n=2 Tax=Halorubrum ezzemoulense TaxID=337243 RepID=A0A256JVA4_HALEZ|nr:hypothetical protein DJ78_01985 [Halorubrum ezzemoulense]